ncbi:MAG: hypothetical protein Kow0042_00540 [Calditrichia bacterium]
MVYFNRIHVFKLVLAGIIIFSLTSCSAQERGESALVESEQFKNYWYSGKAELTHYKLEQARYGEIHPGDAVLIFVTEDFFTDKQVKYERGPKPKTVETVLKLNFMRNFTTGIYPYSMMTSVFTPLKPHNSHSLKVSSSSQEWCGHTYMQLNTREQDYEIRLHSYFQNEADQQLNIKKAWLEDEIWTNIRLAPESLPSGEIEILPGFQYLRLKHQPTRLQKAMATLSETTNPALSDKPLKVYTIDYQDIDRKLMITYEGEFPYQIVAWEETYPSGFGQPRRLTTRAVRTHTLLTDYWTKNSLADSTYRKMLGF